MKATDLPNPRPEAQCCECASDERINQSTVVACRRSVRDRWTTGRPTLLLWLVIVATFGFGVGAIPNAIAQEVPFLATRGSGHEAGSGRRFGEIIGLQVKFAQGEPQENLRLLRELGVRWVREEAHWGHVEKTPGHYEFPRAQKERLEFYRKNGIGVVFILAYMNPKVYPATPDDPYRPADPAAFAKYAVATAKFLKASGVEFVLEVFNEPHNFLRPLIGGMWNGHPPAPWLDHYVKMVRETVKQVKALDSNIKLLSDDDMWIIHYWFLEAGLPEALDGFAFHPYNGGRPPEVAAVDKFTRWLKPFDVIDEDRSLQSAVRKLQAQGKAKLGKTPDLWVTEWGWRTGLDRSKHSLPEDTIATFVPRAYITAEAAGVNVMCWFSSYDAVDGPMGLTDNKGRHRKQYYAFKVMSAQLGDYFLARQLAGTSHLTSGPQAFLFQGATDAKIVAWTVDDKTVELPLVDAISAATVTDLFGERIEPSRRADGTAYVKLSGSPIYIGGVHEVHSLEAVLTSGH